MSIDSQKKNSRKKNVNTSLHQQMARTIVKGHLRPAMVNNTVHYSTVLTSLCPSNCSHIVNPIITNKHNTCENLGSTNKRQNYKSNQCRNNIYFESGEKMRNGKLQVHLEGIVTVRTVLNHKKIKHAIKEKSCVYSTQTKQKRKVRLMKWKKFQSVAK